MEQEFTQTSQTTASNGPLSLPHFDEEATLLSARPVVPLSEVKAERYSRPRLVFALAIVAALFVGALGAMMISAHREEPQGSLATETARPASVVAAKDSVVSPSSDVGGAPIGSSDPTSSVAVREEGSNSKDLQGSRSTALEKRRAPTRPATVARSATAAHVIRSETDDFREDGRERRAEQREVRRLRREAVRQRRRESPDDLLRIREIFEGSSRP